jgi:hypothetical protein
MKEITITPFLLLDRKPEIKKIKHGLITRWLDRLKDNMFFFASMLMKKLMMKPKEFNLLIEWRQKLR